MTFPWVILLAPLFSAGVITLFTLRWKAVSSFISIAAVLVSFTCSCLIFTQSGIAATEFAWIDISGTFKVPLGFTLDQLSKTMLVLVSGVGATIHIYSLGYMRDDEGKSRYFAALSLFMFAMEGPTPISALIHAATMVAAGVYMLVRVAFVIQASHTALLVVAWIGTITAVMAALIATQQNDIKRILAYSTLSQLGYMMMAVGLASNDAAMFHLFTHAFFKALLFLGAGSIIVMLHHEQNIWKMGGLSRKLPITFVTFAVGALALIGCPPFSGFFSKDAILAIAYERNTPIFIVGLFTAFLTAFYVVRLLVIVFFGDTRSEAARQSKESPLVMTGPLIVLAVLAALGGFGFFARNFLALPIEKEAAFLVPALAFGT